jgi:TPR repeat protein
MARPSASIWRWIILTVVGLVVALFLLVLVVEPDDVPETAATEFSTLVTKAQAGDRVAQFKVAGYHARGEDVAQDLTEAAKWLLLSAQQGYAPAQNNIAVCYATGAGVEKDLTQAIAWIRKSADQGYARAQCYLGLSFAKGEGVPRDQAQALDWFRKSAAQGFPDALNHLGYCHSQGRGVPKDEVEAYACWSVAARSHEGAARNLELLEKKISDQNRLRGGVRRDELLRQIEANKSKGS